MIKKLLVVSTLLLLFSTTDAFAQRKKKDSKKALSWFEKALSYKKHEYKNSVDNKAQAAITDINN